MKTTKTTIIKDGYDLQNAAAKPILLKIIKEAKEKLGLTVEYSLSLETKINNVIADNKEDIEDIIKCLNLKNVSIKFKNDFYEVKFSKITEEDLMALIVDCMFDRYSYSYRAVISKELADKLRPKEY